MMSYHMNYINEYIIYNRKKSYIYTNLILIEGLLFEQTVLAALHAEISPV